MSDVAGTESLPTCGQIDRACRLVGMGIDPEQFAEAFEGELEGEALYLAWCAGKANASMEKS